MTKKVKYFQISIIIFVLFTVLVSAIKLTFDGYYGFYYENKPVNRIWVSNFADKLYKSQLLSNFSSYTGFDTGYGFFGPNVSSDFIIVFKIYDEKGNLVKITNDVNLKTKEGLVRFATLNSLFIDKLNEKENEKYNYYLDIIIKQISKYVGKSYPDNYRIETSLLLYDYPTIKTFNENKKEQLILIKKYYL